MKIMQISVNVDVCNIEHVKALEVFTRTLGGLSNTTESTQSIEQAKTVVVTEEKKVEEPKKAARPSRAKVVPTPEPEPEEIEEEEDDLIGDDEEEDQEEEIDSLKLRALTAEKILNNREAIKAQLEKYKVSNVSAIPEAKFKDYYTFLQGLK